MPLEQCLKWSDLRDLAAEECLEWSDLKYLADGECIEWSDLSGLADGDALNEPFWQCILSKQQEIDYFILFYPVFRSDENIIHAFQNKLLPD